MRVVDMTDAAQVRAELDRIRREQVSPPTNSEAARICHLYATSEGLENVYVNSIQIMASIINSEGTYTYTCGISYGDLIEEQTFPYVSTAKRRQKIVMFQYSKTAGLHLNSISDYL